MQARASGESTRHFAPEAASCPAARAFVRGRLERAGIPSATAELLVSELATNAVVHARSRFAVTVSVEPEIRVEVTDENSSIPDRQAISPDREGGRGLVVVAGLADQWGTDVTRSGKTVWFTLRLDYPDPASAGP